ncbi:MFS transporter [Microlunatus elymi]|uniref:MFS transporter n=1 Tax=Microlunatus elymi TaxID=2596828 RepID=A0A516PU69_9ACTN|nr:MFS transporter [Microlunatus elymi]QDP94692.1 MFS transporter [Microlunatus elymi]
MIGPLAAAVGAIMIAVAPTLPCAVSGSVLMGIGTATFTGHLIPLFLVWTPPELTARFQSLFGIVQAVPMVIMNLAYGLIAARLGAGSALLVTAGICAAAAPVVLGNHRLRTSMINSE